MVVVVLVADDASKEDLRGIYRQVIRSSVIDVSMDRLRVGVRKRRSKDATPKLGIR